MPRRLLGWGIKIPRNILILVRATLVLLFLIIVHNIGIVSRRHTKTTVPVEAEVAKASVFVVKKGVQPGCEGRFEKPRIWSERLLTQFALIAVYSLGIATIHTQRTFNVLTVYHIQPFLFLFCGVNLVLARIPIKLMKKDIIVEEVGIREFGERNLFSLFFNK